MKAHIIKNGRIENTVIVDSLESMKGVKLVEVVGNIGDFYDEKTGKATPDPERETKKNQDAIENVIRESLRGSLTKDSAFMYLKKHTAEEIGWYIRGQFPDISQVTDLDSAKETIAILSQNQAKLVDMVVLLAKGLAYTIKRDLE